MSRLRLLAVAAAALALTACAVQTNAVTQAGSPGFWLGVWHGFIFPFAFLVGGIVHFLGAWLGGAG